jgi:chemotaxis response regulator CheB
VEDCRQLHEVREPKKRTSPKASKQEAAVHPTPKDDLLIAAVGASAGGIEAFTELMTNLPADSGMAFVLVQHLDPKHHSLLTELLSKKTAMCVTEVTDGMKAERDHVYVIPPNATMSISNHTLQLRPREESRGLHMPIDLFMRAGGRTWESRHRRDLVGYGDGRNAGNGGNSSARRSHLRAGWRFRETPWTGRRISVRLSN